jgi:hypothetical protein
MMETTSKSIFMDNAIVGHAGAFQNTFGPLKGGARESDEI